MAEFGGTTPRLASDITSSTTATLEWAAQVTAVPSSTSRNETVAIAPSNMRKLGSPSYCVINPSNW